jgi:hypothetical protein
MDSERRSHHLKRRRRALPPASVGNNGMGRRAEDEWRALEGSFARARRDAMNASMVHRARYGFAALIVAVA